MANQRTIYCCGCAMDSPCRLTDGREIYPHHPDFADRPFWKCLSCGNYVGCHWQTNHPTRPLGNIPTPEMRNARQHIHARLDPLWKEGRLSRKQLYQRLGVALGREYHTSELRTIAEARVIYAALIVIERSLSAP